MIILKVTTRSEELTTRRCCSQKQSAGATKEASERRGSLSTLHKHNTGVHLLAQADTQEFYSSHMHFPKHQTHRNSIPRTCIYVHVCISLLCTHSFLRDVYSCLSLRWAAKNLGHPLKAKGKDWIERNPADRLAIDLTSAQAQAQATPAPRQLPEHIAGAMRMAECIWPHGSQHQVPQSPAFGFLSAQSSDNVALRGIVVPPRPIFGRNNLQHQLQQNNASIVPFGSGAASSSSQLGSFQQGLMVGSLLHTQEEMARENQQLRSELEAARGLEQRFPT